MFEGAGRTDKYMLLLLLEVRVLVFWWTASHAPRRCLPGMDGINRTLIFYINRTLDFIRRFM